MHGPSALDELFEAVDHRGWLCVLEIDGAGQVSYGADELVVGASTFKLAVALDLYCRVAVGELELDQHLVFRAERSDSEQASLAEAALMMMSVSDNAAADALIDLLGTSSINARLRACGLTRTTVRAGVQVEVHAITAELDPYAVSAGFSGWVDMVMRQAHLTEDERRQLTRVTVPDTVPSHGRGAPTTARDMATLVRAIWRDEAGPAVACAQIRELMTHQTVQRLTHAFADDPAVSVAAKGGRIPGLVRNDVGALSTPHGRYAAAVFARADYPFAGEEGIDAALGHAAGEAIAMLTAR